MVSARALLVAVVVSAGLLVPAAAQAAPPPNDLFAAAEVLTGTAAATSATNNEATTETGEPSHWNTASGSVWFRWTAPRDGVASIDTAGSQFDTVLAAYTGATVDGLTRLASNDDAIGLQSRIQFPVAAGTT